MTAPLRPMTLGEILDRTFQIYRSQFLKFAGIAAIPAVAMLCIHLLDNPWLHGPSSVYLTRRGSTAWGFLISLAYYHLASMLDFIAAPAHAYLTSTTFFGEAQSLRSSLRFALARWRSFLWVAILKICVELVAPELLVFGLIAAFAFFADRAGSFNGGSSAMLAGLAVAFLVLAGMVLSLSIAAGVSLSMPAAALESVNGLKALRRSLFLTKGSRVRIFIPWLCVAIFGGLLIATAQIILRMMLRHFLFGVYTQHLYLPAAHLLNAIFTTFIGPIVPIALTLFYYDQRIRLEGYDIERMMDSAGMTDTAGLTAPIIPPQGAEIVAPEAFGEPQS